MLPECFLHWTEAAGVNDEDVFRLSSWRRSLTLKGTSFREFEAEVLPLLTGRLTVDEISEQVADVFHRDELVAALNMLASQGILVEGSEHGTIGPGLTAQAGWLSEVAPDRRQAQQKLVDAHVVVFGAGLHGAVVARSLVAAGIGKLTIVDPAHVAPSDLYFSGLFSLDDMETNRADALAARLLTSEGGTALESQSDRPKDSQDILALITGASLVLCCLDSGELHLAQQLNLACRSAGVNWIAASLEGTELVVGPGFFRGDNGPCYTCWRVREISGSANPESRLALEMHLDGLRSDISGRRENLASAADIVGGMLATEALTWLTESSGPNLDGRFLTVGLPGLRVEKHTVLRKPGCPVCGPAAGSTK
jgi:adenylyltransferase/sulfurtransferase